MKLTIVFIICIFSCKFAKAEKNCAWAPKCKCDHLEQVDFEAACIYNSFYNEGHDVAICQNLHEFPKLLPDKPMNDYTEVSGDFDKVPANAFDAPQFTSACVQISTTNKNLHIESDAFRNAWGTFILRNIKNVTVADNVFNADPNLVTYNRYGLGTKDFSFINIQNLYLPEKVSFKKLITHQVDVSEVKIDLLIENSNVVNTDGRRFDFSDAEMISLDDVKVGDFREITNLFKITSEKKISKRLSINIFKPNPDMTVKIIVENATFSNFENKNAVNLGLPLNRVKSISFLEGTTLSYFHDLSIFNDSLESFTCRECGLTKIPGEIQSLSKLDALTLSYNKISEIPKNLLPGTLSYLNLADNKIQRIDKHAFENLKHLKYIELSRNLIGKRFFDVVNSLGEVSIELTEFHCAGCDFVKIPHLITNNDKLEILSLADNDIERIRKDDFRKAKNLIILDFNNNKITHADRGVFEELFVQYLRLENNSFIEMDIANITFKINESDSAINDTRIGISLANNEHLLKVFITKSPKNRVYCPYLGLDNCPNLEKIDKNLFIHCKMHQCDSLGSFGGSKNFACHEDLEWLAKIELETMGECNKDSHLGKLSHDGTTCKENGQDMNEYMWEKYFSKQPKCTHAKISEEQ